MGNVSNNKNDGPDIAVTDNGNYLVDLYFTSPIKGISSRLSVDPINSLHINLFVFDCFIDAVAAAEEIKSTVGVVDHGIFAGMVSSVIVATAKDGVRVAGVGGEDPWW